MYLDDTLIFNENASIMNNLRDSEIADDVVNRTANNDGNNFRKQG